MGADPASGPQTGGACDRGRGEQGWARGCPRGGRAMAGGRTMHLDPGASPDGGAEDGRWGDGRAAKGKRGRMGARIISPTQFVGLSWRQCGSDGRRRQGDVPLML